MTDSSPPDRSALVLAAQIDELRNLIRELRDEQPHINDAQLKSSVKTLADGAEAVFDSHHRDLRPSIADDLASLMSAVRALKIPTDNPVIEGIPAVVRLRTSKRRIIGGLGDALDSAALIGLVPRAPRSVGSGAILPRPGIGRLLDGILRRTILLEKSLDTLEKVETTSVRPAQQDALSKFYLSSMRAEVNLAKLHLTIADTAIDFGALARAVESMLSLTLDFITTARAWTPIFDHVIEAAIQIQQSIEKISSRVIASALSSRRNVRGLGQPISNAPLEESNFAFVAMDFDPDGLPFYAGVIKPTIEECGIACRRGDEFFGPGIVFDQLKNAIRSCIIVVADISDANPNVLMEVAVALTLEKPTILICRDDTRQFDVPFDIRHFRRLVYRQDAAGGVKLRRELIFAVQEILT